MHDLDKAIRAAMMTAHRYARGGYAGGGGAESVLMQEMPTYDPMGNVSVPAFGPAPEQKPIAMENPERVRAAEDAARLAKEIQAFEASKAQIQTQPEWARMMTHAPQEPRAPVQIEGGFIGNRQLGTAPYPVANALSGMAQGAYDFKTAPLYGLGAVFPPAAALGTALDTAEGVAAGSPTQVAMGAFGTPMKAVRNVIAPLTVASGLTAPDEAEAARAPRLGGLSAALSKTAPKAGEMSLEQAMNIAKSIPARELSPLGFYSHGAETAAGLQQAKGTPEQYAAMLQKAGVKPAELEGFGEAFAGRPSVTREEIAAHFKERMPQIEETVLGVNAARKSKLDAINNELGSLADSEIAAGRVPAENPRFKELEKQYYEIADNSLAETPTKFGQYTLPGGENYREVRLTLPEGYGAPQKALDDLAAAKERASAASKAYTDALMAELDGTSKLSPEAFAALEKENSIASSRVKNFEKLAKQPAFQSSHWPDAPNTVAHLRMADRTGPNGEKILHVEEIQSDWGQKGKKEGFVTKYNPEDIKEMDPANITSERRRNEFWNFETPTGAIDVPRNNRWPTIEAARQHILDNVKPTGVPTAPYVTNTQAWTDLALKRALREAAEGGYDKLVWTPGAEQAKRYKLTNHINSIDYMREGEDAYRLGITNKRGEGIDLPKDTFTAKELEDYLGKEVAQKIVEDEGKAYRGRNHKTLEGLDLEVGGSGMKGYYDKIVPNQLSKLVKKLDPEAKVGVHDLITKKGGKVADEAALNENSQLIEQGRFWDDARAENVNGYRVTLPGGQELGVFEDLPDAHDALLQALGSAKEPDTILKVPSLTITPKMREAIMKGQTAFKRGGSIPFGPEAAQRAVQIAKQQAGRR